jgi:hypothetical protein
MRLAKILSFLFFLPVFLFAGSYEGEIYTWGYGELYALER